MAGHIGGNYGVAGAGAKVVEVMRVKKTVDTIERFAVEYQKLTKGRSWIIKTF